MKKIILAAAAATTILASSAAFAGTKDAFYLKGNVGWNKMKDGTEEIKISRFTTSRVKYKAENSFSLGLGVGYYLMDNVRFDLMFDHFFDPEWKGSVSGSAAKASIKAKGEINALTLNGYVDLFDVSIAKIFAGAGVGMAQVKDKFTLTSSPNDGTPAETSSISSKKANNFTYALHLGASMEFAPGVNGDLSYSWKDFGKTKENKVSFKGHNLVFGVRFDI